MIRKSAMCDSCDLGKENRMKPYREEKLIIFPGHFLYTQHCSDAGADVYSIGPYFPTFHIVANRANYEICHNMLGQTDEAAAVQRRLPRNSSSCPDPMQASYRLRALISGPICSRDMIGVLS